MNNIKIFNQYTGGNKRVSYRRFKKSLENMRLSTNPSELMLASTIMFKGEDDTLFIAYKERLLKQLADSGFFPALDILGEAYYAENMFSTAYKMFERSAKMGSPYGARFMAEVYKNGKFGFPKDDEKFEYYNKIKTNKDYKKVLKLLDYVPEFYLHLN